MMFSTKAEYGVRVMAHLAKHDGERPISLATIADAEGLPLAYLEHLVQRLRKAGLVESRRGAHGGYTLAREAEEITMAEVVRGARGRDRSDRVHHRRRRRRARLRPRGRAGHDPCPTKLLWTRVQGSIVRTLNEMTLADLVQPDLKKAEGNCMTLEVQNLHVRTEDREILHGVDLVVKKGETHALMGPNGSGKSTLANTLMGNPNYEVTEGRILLNGEDLTEADPDERARAGLFMAFQYPATIPGVSVANFMRMAMNAGREEPIKVKEFGALLKKNMELLKIDRAFTSRYLNEGFSGGEKKRAEILQLAMLQPDFAVLDETDSGLDIDALRIVSEGVNAMRGDERGFLIITHYTRILNYVKPDFVHILIDGRIVREGGPSSPTSSRRRATSSCARRWPRVAPEFVEDRRRAALEVYESEDVPTWRRSGFWTTTLRGLDLDALEPRRYEPGLPQLDLGDDEHSALIVQRGANVVHTDLNDDQIIVMPLEQAVEEHPELVQEQFGKRLPFERGQVRRRHGRVLDRRGVHPRAEERAAWRSRSRWSG